MKDNRPFEMDWIAALTYHAGKLEATITHMKTPLFKRLEGLTTAILKRMFPAGVHIWQIRCNAKSLLLEIKILSASIKEMPR